MLLIITIFLALGFEAGIICHIKLLRTSDFIVPASSINSATIVSAIESIIALEYMGERTSCRIAGVILARIIVVRRLVEIGAIACNSLCIINAGWDKAHVSVVVGANGEILGQDFLVILANLNSAICSDQKAFSNALINLAAISHAGSGTVHANVSIFTTNVRKALTITAFIRQASFVHLSCNIHPFPNTVTSFLTNMMHAHSFWLIRVIRKLSVVICATTIFATLRRVASVRMGVIQLLDIGLLLRQAIVDFIVIAHKLVLRTRGMTHIACTKNTFVIRALLVTFLDAFIGLFSCALRFATSNCDVLATILCITENIATLNHIFSAKLFNASLTSHLVNLSPTTLSALVCGACILRVVHLGLLAGP